MAEATLNQLHPSVTSVINTETYGYESANGNQKLFCADVFEKGVDNKIGYVTSVSEFLFKYGEPNINKYGQAGYNILNWLEAGGEAYILRVLPEDATYSHVILNIQTSTSTKTIKDKNGDVITIENGDVTLKPLATYMEANNTQEEILQNELYSDRNATTVDGFLNHFILLVYPLGRGVAYNKLGFRISLNSSYDSIQNSRIYNFEVVEYDNDASSYSIVEGPFYVSFDPDCISTSTNESMFIEDVINKYSEYYRCKFNNEEYEKLAAIINPKVNPYIIDVLSGKTRNVNGVSDTYTNDYTGKVEDVHMSLYKYNNNGEVITSNDDYVRNIIQTPFDVENAIVDIDNSVRRTQYNRINESIEYMKTLLSKISSTDRQTIKNEIKAIINRTVEEVEVEPAVPAQTHIDSETGEEVIDVPAKDAVISTVNHYSGALVEIINNYLVNDLIFDDETGEQTEESNADNVITPYEKLILAMKEYEKDHSDVNFLKINEDCAEIDDKIQEVFDKTTELLSYYSAVKDSADSTGSDSTAYNMINANINQSTTWSNQRAIVSNQSIYRKNKILDITTNILKFINDYTLDEETIDNMEYVAVDVKDIYDYVNSNLNIGSIYDGLTINDDYSTITLVNGVPKVDIVDKIKQVEEIYNPIIGVISNIKDGYTNLTDTVTYNDITANNEVVEDLVFKYVFNQLYKAVTILDEIITSAVYYVNISTVFKLVDLIQNQYVLNCALINESLMNKIYDDDKGENQTLSTEKIITLIKENIDLYKSNLVSLNKDLFVNTIQTVNSPVRLLKGNDGSFSYDTSYKKERENAINKMRIKAYKGLVDEDLLNTNLILIDHIIDANYPVDVKAAIVSLARDLRGDFFYWADTNKQATPQDAIDWRNDSFNYYTNLMGIFSQDFVVNDASYTGRDINVTTPYFIASKLPYNIRMYGEQFTIAGPRRGIIEGFKSVSWIPNESYKEMLYSKRINYIESDTRRTKIGSQLTAESSNTPLSNINNVLVLLKMKRNVEQMAADYQFEFNDNYTISAFSSELNNYLSNYVANRSCTSVSANVYASDYDKQHKILRVSITVQFNNVIERIIINFDVVV